MFCEGYLLHRKRLIKLWIAEGFVQERGTNTLEEVAEDYLNELINRSMLQVEETNNNGRVRSFRMHYLMRELAFSLSRKESFHTVYDNNATAKVDNDRRLAVHECSTDMSSSINMPLLRTFKAFNGGMLSSLFLSSVLTKSGYLAVLDLDRSAIETIPDEIGDLFNLRYLGLRNSKVKSLPESIEKLFNLQTLDLVGSDINKLPLGIVKLNKLRHLSARKLFDSDEIFFQYIPAPQTPEGLWNLKELQTLMAVEAKGELVERLKDLTQLRSLGIYILKDIDVAKLCFSLMHLHSLSRLYLIANDEEIGLQTDGLSIPPPHLYFLFMRGRLSTGIVNYWFGDHGNSLRELILVDSKLEDDQMTSFSHLSNLTRLILQGAYNGKRLRFGAGCFPILQHLSIGHMPHLSQVEIENGAIVSLDTLILRDLAKLKVVPEGVEFLTCLRQLKIISAHKRLIASLEEIEVLRNLRHIAQIDIN